MIFARSPGWASIMPTRFKPRQNLALFRETLKPEHRDAAIRDLQQSAFYWRSFASLALSNHENPLWTNRVGYVDWRDTYRYVIHDIRTIGGTIDIASMPPTAGGTILEAEDAEHEAFEIVQRDRRFHRSPAMSSSTATRAQSRLRGIIMPRGPVATSSSFATSTAGIARHP